ncbi:TPA: hypothetical protein EYP38_00760 [Candidatus Micrarchaeota archaeon]|nr:hypothetical protein [Candidatus Micrarchaeota archaeon]
MVKKKNKKSGKKASRKVTKKRKAAKKTRRPKGLPVSVKKKSISMMEDETLKKAKQTIASIEKFMRRWEKADSKPRDMQVEVVRLQRYHDALEKWHKEASRARKKGETEAERIDRLRDFIMICFTYS